MTRNDFIKAVATATNNSQKASKELIDTIGQIIVDGMKSGEDVKAFEGITFAAKDVAERNARNPQTGETVIVPAKVKPVCKFGVAVKNYLND